MKAIIIVNPRARSGDAPEERTKLRDTVTQRLKKIAVSVEWCETRYPTHATRLAHDAAENGYDYVLAAGGDGTISEVLNGIMASPARPIFGVLPWGSLNDFYRALQAAEARLDPAVAHDPYTQPLDIGRVMLDNVERYCCLSISIGLASWANQQVQLSSLFFGRRLGLFPGALNALLSYRFASGINLSLDAAPAVPRRMLAVEISNSPSVGGGAKLTPNARIDDGTFDVCLIPPMSYPKLAALLLRSYLGGTLGDSEVELHRARTITITAAERFPVLLDGEMIPEIGAMAHRIDIRVLPTEMRILRPSVLE